MRIREFTTSGKHYQGKQLCLKALNLLSEHLPIESLHTSYNSTENSVTAWFTFALVNSCFKVEFLELSELLDFLEALDLRHPPETGQVTRAAQAEKVYQDLQKIIAENA